MARDRTGTDYANYPDELQPQCVKDTCIYNKPETYIAFSRNDCAGRLTYETCVVQCLNGYRNLPGAALSEEIACLIDNHFENSTVRCEAQTCVRFAKQAELLASAFHVDARDCGLGLTSATRGESPDNVFRARYDRTFDSCFVGCLPGYKDY